MPPLVNSLFIIARTPTSARDLPFHRPAFTRWTQEAKAASDSSKPLIADARRDRPAQLQPRPSTKSLRPDASNARPRFPAANSTGGHSAAGCKLRVHVDIDDSHGVGQVTRGVCRAVIVHEHARPGMGGSVDVDGAAKRAVLLHQGGAVGWRSWSTRSYRRAALPTRPPRSRPPRAASSRRCARSSRHRRS